MAIGTQFNWNFLAPILAAKRGVNGGHNQHRDQRGDDQTTNDRATKRRILLAAFAKTKRHGHHARDHCGRGHDDGTKSGCARAIRRSARIIASQAPVVCKSHNQNTVGGSNTNAHDCAHQTWNIERGVGAQQHKHNARKRAGHRENNHKWIHPTLKVDHHKEIHQHNGGDQTNGQSNETGAHVVVLSAQRHGCSTRQILARRRDKLLHAGPKRAKVNATRRHQHIKHGLHVVVAHRNRCETARDVGHGLQLTSSVGAACARQRRVGQVVHVVKIGHGSLHRD